MLAWATEQLDALEKDVSSLGSVRRRTRELLEVSPFSTRLAEPFRVVLAGPPNVGKSSLLNAIVGFDRSITLDQAGTTRDVLHANTVIDGIAIRISDTAGIRDSDEAIEQQGIARARLVASEADLVLSVSEPSLEGGSSGRTEPLDGPAAMIRVLNKSDRLQHPLPSNAYDFATSALTGEGVGALMAAIGNRLGRWIPKPGTPVPINHRQANLLHQVAIANSNDEAATNLRLLLMHRQS
jgi:tRNA modification GTPase